MSFLPVPTDDDSGLNRRQVAQAQKDRAATALELHRYGLGARFRAQVDIYDGQALGRCQPRGRDGGNGSVGVWPEPGWHVCRQDRDDGPGGAAHGHHQRPAHHAEIRRLKQCSVIATTGH